MTGVEDVIRRLIARLGDAADFHFSPKYVDCVVEEYVGKIAGLGNGTCHADETDTIKCWVKCKDEPSTEHMELIHVMECSACGGTYEHVNGEYEYCPRCGRRVEVDE